MKQDRLPEEISQALGRLGLVVPPEPGVLDAAREVLWAAVAAEMLPGETGQTGETGSRWVDQRQTDQRQTDQRQTDRHQTGQPGQAGAGDPGA